MKQVTPRSFGSRSAKGLRTSTVLVVLVVALLSVVFVRPSIGREDSATTKRTVISEIPVRLNGASKPRISVTDLASGDDGRLWFASGGYVGFIDSAGVTTAYQIGAEDG